MIEEFKRCIHSDIRTHLDEHKVNTSNEASVKADDYALSRKGHFYKSGSKFDKKYNNAKRSDKHNKSYSGQFNQSKQT